jgi:hypothetical protein
MPNDPQDSDLLVEFELKNITGDYREYNKIKRNNLFANIQAYLEMWQFFCKLDEIWRHEIGDLEVATAPDGIFPMMLYFNAHAKMRISVELGFSSCIQEARSILRDAVENVAHAHHMLRDQNNLKIWLDKDDPQGKKAFHQCFEANKKTNLFKGIEDLYEKYGQLSDAGSHPTLISLHNRMSIVDTPEGKSMRLHYTGAPDERTFATELFSRLLTCFVMEGTFYEDYKGRLHLDAVLVDMRTSFEAFKEDLRQKMIVRYNMKLPAQRPAKP